MRLGLVVLLCLLNAGCAVLRNDREEPVERPSARKEKAGPVLKPSEALKPESLAIASPATDHFYMRGIYFQPSVTTDLQLNASNNTAGTFLNGEDDLGLDDTLNQGRMEFDVRMENDHHLRVDFFKSSRFSQQPLANDIEFGDFDFDAGTTFRSKLDWRVFSLTYMYAPLHTERFEAGILHGIHIVQAQAEGGEPGTTDRERVSEVGIVPTLGVGGSVRITKKFAFTLRAQYMSVTIDETSGTFADYHADIQYRFHKNFAIGLGYTKLQTELIVRDADLPLLFNMDTSGPELFFRVSF